MYDRPQRDADCSSKGDWKGMENVSVQDIVLATGGVLLSGDDGVMLNKIRLDSRSYRRQRQMCIRDSCSPEMTVSC